MLIVLINKTAVLGNPLEDILKGILTLIIEGRFYLDKDMCTTLISFITQDTQVLILQDLMSRPGTAKNREK